MSIVTVNKNTYTVEPLYQWDKDQTLEIRGLSLAKVPEIHFAHEGMSRAIVRQSTMDAAGVVTVDVPNSLLQKPYTVHVYVCAYTGGTFETLYKIDVPVKARECPADYTLENDPEVYSFNALENDVANALYAMEQAVKSVNTVEEKLRTEFDVQMKEHTHALGDLTGGTAFSVVANDGNGKPGNVTQPEKRSVLTSQPGDAPKWVDMGQLSNEHLWAKSLYGELLTEASSGLQYATNIVLTLTICDSVTINPKTGEITLVGVQSVASGSINGVVQGRYVDMRSTSGVLHKVPEDATVTVSGTAVTVSPTLSVSTAIEVVGYVNDVDENAHADDENYFYTYVGRIGGKTGFDVLSDTDVLNTLLGVN